MCFAFYWAIFWSAFWFKSLFFFVFFALFAFCAQGLISENLFVTCFDSNYTQNDQFDGFDEICNCKRCGYDLKTHKFRFYLIILCVCVMSDERANGAIWWLNNVIRKEKREFNLIAWDEKNEDKNVKPGHKPTIITIRVVLSHAQKTLSALISCLIYAFFGSFLFSCFLVRFH